MLHFKNHTVVINIIFKLHICSNLYEIIFQTGLAKRMYQYYHVSFKSMLYVFNQMIIFMFDADNLENKFWEINFAKFHAKP